MAVVRERGTVVTSADNLLHIATEQGWLQGLTEEVLFQRDLVREQSRRRDIRDRMRWRSPAIAGAYEKLMLPILASEPTAVPMHGDDSDEAQERTQILTDHLRRGSGFTEVLAAALEIPWSGWGGVELTGKRGGFGDVRKGEPLLNGAIQVAAEAIRFSPQGQPRIRTTGHEHEGEPMDDRKWRWKFIVGSWGSKASGNWYGQGMDKRVYWLWLFLTQNMKSWTTALEKYASPALKAKYLGKDFKGNADEIVTILQDFTAQGHLVETPDWDIQLLGGTSGTRAFPGYEKHNEVIEAAIVKSIVGATLTTDTQGVGSQSLGTVHSDEVTDRQKSFARWAAGLLSDTLIPSMEEALFGARFGSRLELNFAEREDVEENRANLTTAAELGLEMKTEQLYRMLKIDPPREDMDETIVLSKAQPGAMPPMGGDGADLQLFAEGAQARAGMVDARNENRRLDALEGASVGAAAAAAKAMTDALADDVAKEVGRSARKR